MSTSAEPELSVTARRLLAALLLSVALHLAIFGLVGGQGVRAGQGTAIMQVTIRPAPLAAKPSVPRVSIDAPKPVPSPMPLPAPAPPTVAPAPAPAPAAEAASSRPVLRLDMTPLVDSTYYTPRELDVLPRASVGIMPEFPDSAAQHGQQGWVLLTVRLDDSGVVQSVRVKAGDPPGVFDQSALEAFRHAHFEPGRKGGRPVNTEMDIRVEYQLDTPVNPVNGVRPPDALK